jgi:eukaryotic-like serine/threonine-protein kinase
VSDVQALAWLDRLLDLGDRDRASELEGLENDDVTLHEHVLRLLAAADVTDGSRILAHPVVNELAVLREVSPVAFEPGQTIGGYRLLREIGRGGMSVVWRAQRIDRMIDRDVALKLPLFAPRIPLDVERFAREKDVLATLTHPNIARLYDAGVSSCGQPFIVLELVDGLPMTGYCDQHRLDIPGRLRIFLQVLAAVDHAHRHLVVHRDLKPANLLVDADGQVKLLDFGIAKLLDDPAGRLHVMQLTQQGNAVLTPSYAAPEQVCGQPISTLCDVYVLGVLLYELLTGTLPHATGDGAPASLAHMVESLLHGTSAAPSQAPLSEAAVQARSAGKAKRLRAALAGDLDSIVHKALRRVPAQRYASVQHFADDIQRFLSRQPIAARPRSVWYSAGLFLARHRGAAAIAVLGAVLSGAGAVMAWQQHAASREHAARTAAVRDFMFDLVNDAEPDESQPDAQVTGKLMLDSAVRRARRDFSAQPRLQGELLGELGRMYRRLEEPEAAREVLSSAMAILEREAPPEDVERNKTTAHLADILADDEEHASAERLALRVRAACVPPDIECAKARAYASNVLGKIYLSRGRLDESLTAMRQMVRDITLGFGERDTETAMALLSLAIIARNGGQLQEAGDAMTRALDISAGQTMRSVDRQQLLRTAAVLDFDLGRYASAQHRLVDLLAQVRNRDERALQLRLLANVQLAQGEATAAVDSAEAAIALADPLSPDAELLFARQVRAQALATLEPTQASLAEIQAVIEGLGALGRSGDSPEVLRARRIRAEMLLNMGRTAESLEELQRLSAQLRDAPGKRVVELGQTLDLMGRALRQLGRSREALAAHASARVAFEEQLQADHPFLQRNALLRQRAGEMAAASLTANR